MRHDRPMPSAPHASSAPASQLPPAPLPEWDGKLNIQRFVEGEEPPKPAEELVEKLAAAKGLDPATGLPLPKKETARRWWNWWD